MFSEGTEHADCMRTTPHQLLGSWGTNSGWI